MARRADDEGQVLLLAGVLLVLAFIAFSIQLSLVTNLGQQTGRDIVNPLLDDYLEVRSSFQEWASQDLHNANGVPTCPDLFYYGMKARGELEQVRSLEANRGHSLNWSNIRTSQVGPSFPVAGQTWSTISLNVTVLLSDAVTTVGDAVAFRSDCQGTPVNPPACQGASVCVIP